MPPDTSGIFDHSTLGMKAVWPPILELGLRFPLALIKDGDAFYVLCYSQQYGLFVEE